MIGAGHIALIGPTASGKSSVALEVARRLGSVELLSIDSMQVYREMDIGTAKPSPAEQTEVPHHLIDLADPADDFHLGLFLEAFDAALAGVEERGNSAILVGGTGLYLQTVVDRFELPGRFPEVRDAIEAEPDTRALHARLAALDPVAAGRMEPNNRRRVVRALEVAEGSGRPFSSFGPGVDAYPEIGFSLVGIRLPRPVIDQRIDARYEQQMADGFLGEVEALIARPGGLGTTARQALGYRELLGHIEDDVALPEALRQARFRTRRFARRQERWFRRDPRIRWLDAENPVAIIDEVLRDCERARSQAKGRS